MSIEMIELFHGQNEVYIFQGYFAVLLSKFKINSNQVNYVMK